MPTRFMLMRRMTIPPKVQTLLQHASGDAPPIAVFDCDGTIIRGDIGEAMLYYQLEHFLLRINPANVWLDYPHREELNTLYMELAALPEQRRLQDRRYASFAQMIVEWYFDQLREEKTQKACSDIVRLLAKFSEQEVAEIAAATWQDELSSPLTVRTIGKFPLPKGIRYIAESVHLLQQLRAAGFEIWAVSGSNVWTVRQVFEPLGIPRERILGIDLHSSSNVLSPKVRTPVPVLEGKVEALQQAGARDPAIVVSDSIYDVPLFEYAQHLKVLITSRMETSYTFFKESGLAQDETWVVVEHPTDLPPGAVLPQPVNAHG